jgi:hypothetical protein
MIAPSTRKVVPNLAVEFFPLPRRQAAAFCVRVPLPHRHCRCRSRLSPIFEITSLSSSFFSLSEVLQPECSMAVSDTAPATTAHRCNVGELPIGAVVVVNISVVTFRVGDEPACRPGRAGRNCQMPPKGSSVADGERGEEALLSSSTAIVLAATGEIPACPAGPNIR